MPRGDSYQTQGQQGGVVLSVGGAQTAYVGRARWVQCVTDCTFSTITGNLVNASNLTGKTFFGGSGIGGVLTNVVISAGTAIVYDA